MAVWRTTTTQIFRKRCPDKILPSRPLRGSQYAEDLFHGLPFAVRIVRILAGAVCGRAVFRQVRIGERRRIVPRRRAIAPRPIVPGPSPGTVERGPIRFRTIIAAPWPRTTALRRTRRTARFENDIDLLTLVGSQLQRRDDIGALERLRPLLLPCNLLQPAKLLLVEQCKQFFAVRAADCR